MKKINSIKIFYNGLVLVVMFLSKAFAGIATPCGQENGDTDSNCWSCGSDCTARYDSASNTLTFSGTKTEEIGHYGSQSPWLTDMPTRNLSKIVFAEGIESIAGCFSGYVGLSAQEVLLPSTLKDISGGVFYRLSTPNLVIPETVEKITGNIFYDTRVQRVVIPENTRVYYPWLQGDVELGWSSSGTLYCTSSKCGSNALIYEKDGDNYVVYDKDGNITQIFASFEDFAANGDVISGSYTKKDENGKIVATYDGNGRILSKYLYDTDGSISIYDANGKLIGLQGKRILTVDEASALVKDNKNTFTLRYR